MSGGSYDYLCYAAGDAGSLAGKQHRLEDMAVRLDGMGYILAARATRDVARFLAAAEHASEALEDVWHAMEWADSGDWSQDQVPPVLAAFKPWPPEPEGTPA